MRILSARTVESRTKIAINASSVRLIEILIALSSSRPGTESTASAKDARYQRILISRLIVKIGNR